MGLDYFFKAEMFLLLNFNKLSLNFLLNLKSCNTVSFNCTISVRICSQKFKHFCVIFTHTEVKWKVVDGHPCL